MANEFVARRGIIVPTGGASLTGSVLISGPVNALGYSVTATAFTGSFSGSIGTATTASYVSPSGLPAGTVSASSQVVWSQVAYNADIVSSSTQVKAFLPDGTVSSSAQYPGWVTASSQIDVTQTTNYNLLPTLAGANVFTNINTIAATGSYGTLKIIGPSASEASIAFKTTDVSDGTSGNWILGTNQSLLNTKQFGLWNGANSSVFPLVVDPNGQVGINLNRALAQNVTAPLTVVGNANITGSLIVTNGITGSILANNGVVSSSGQVDITATTGYTSFSSSIATKNNIQDVSINALNNQTGSYATTGSNNFVGVQTISNTTNSTNYTDGALVVHGGVGIEKDVNISGSLNVIGLLTVTSQSIQYVTGSIYNVGTNKITVNTNNSLRFGGISVNDSGSSPVNSGSLYWDSYTNRWIYENISGSTYNSAILIAGPKNTGSLGDETGLITGRIPVAQGDDHINTDPSLTPLRVEGTTLHIEGNAYATGSITASAFSGDGSQLTGIVTTLYLTGSDASTGTVNLKTQGLTVAGANGITTSISGQTVTIKAPLGTVSSSAQYPGWVTASSQILLDQITGATFSNQAFLFPSDVQLNGDLTVAGNDIKNSSGQVALTFNNGIDAGDVKTGGTLIIGGNSIRSANQTSCLTLTNNTGDVAVTGDLTVTGNDIKNNNGTAVITFAGTSNNDVRLWSSGALDVSSGEIRNSGTTAIQMSGQNVQIINSGSMNAAKINNTYYSGSTPSTIIGPVSNQVVATLKAADYDASHFDYVVKDGTNYRTGTVMAVWDGTNVEFTDTSTNDIGNTSGVSFTVDINSGLVRLKITTGTGNWTLKTSIRAL